MGEPGESPVAIHASPHPDDELIGAGATLMSLRDAGWQVVNVACSLGRAGDRERRRAELTEACRRAGFALEIPDGLPGIGRDDDHDAARIAIAGVLADAIGRHRASLIVGPAPEDAHHAHRTVGLALQDAVVAHGAPIRLLLWGLWAQVRDPNVIVGFGEERLAELQAALAAHAGELERAPFERLVRARAETSALLGAERLFGFGSAGTGEQYAELLTELSFEPRSGFVRSAPRAWEH